MDYREVQENDLFSIALTNLGAYNRGSLQFEWLNMPATDEEFQETLKKIGIDGVRDEEYFISDFDDYTGLQIAREFGEYASFQELNELAERLEELKPSDKIKLQAISEFEGSEWALEALWNDDLDDVQIIPNVETLEQLGESIAEWWLPPVPEELSYYIDYDAVGRDFDSQVCGGFVNGGYCYH